MSKIVTAILAVFLCFAAVPAVAATTGMVRGTILVNDKPQAGVTMTLQGEGASYKTTTDQNGDYEFAVVPFGRYTLRASYPGLALSSAIVDVASDQIAHVNLVLGLKTIAETAIRAGTGVSGAPVSQNAIGRQEISALPVNNSLNQIIETVPGIVKFSYNEPVAHGFHGVTYELDGAPLPLATSSNFAEIIDPKSIDSLEVFTGAMPAEYGGSRQGAVINILSDRASDLSLPYQGFFTAGSGNDGQSLLTFDNSIKSGNTEIFFNANTQKSNRGLDAPTPGSTHDDSSQSDEFLRTITRIDQRRSLSFDFSNQLSQFQIPINTSPNDVTDPTFAVPGTDDVQNEYDRFASVNFTSVSKGGNGVLQVIPWLRYTRIAYNGDLSNDVLGLTNLGACSDQGLTDPTCTANPNAVVYQAGAGLRQDRRANYLGLRASNLIASTHHAVKIGFDASREVLDASQTFACYDPSCSTQTYTYPLPAPPAPGYTAFNTTQGQAGTQVGVYVQDKWTPSHALSADFGVRYDNSTGYVGGEQLSPRLGVNVAVDPNDILHAYYGRFYSAPQLEDVRQACVLLSGCGSSPTYDLKPETDSYAELGLAHTFSPDVRGYVNAWTRSVNNVLDTTQLLNTPLFAVYNNTIGRAHGYETRLQGSLPNSDSWFLSGTWSSSQAACISGSTFLFPVGSTCDPTTSLIGQLQAEDHDQTIALTSSFTHRFGAKKAFFATLDGEYGTGYPVSFQGLVNGTPVSFQGRLRNHLTADFAIGRDPGRNGDRTLGFDLDVENLFNDQYIIKIANGFNTTQYAQGRNVLLRLTAPF